MLLFWGPMMFDVSARNSTRVRAVRPHVVVLNDFLSKKRAVFSVGLCVRVCLLYCHICIVVICNAHLNKSSLHRAQRNVIVICKHLRFCTLFEICVVVCCAITVLYGGRNSGFVI